MLKAEILMRRRAATPWDKSELKALKENRASIEATSEDEWALLARWFDIPQEKTRARKGLAALLNNWNTEITRAQAYEQSHPYRPDEW